MIEPEIFERFMLMKIFSGVHRNDYNGRVCQRMNTL